MKTIEESIQNLTEYLIREVKSENIESFWRKMHSRKFSIIRNSYRFYNDQGKLVGWQEFSVQIPLDGNLNDWRLRFHDYEHYSEASSLRKHLKALIDEHILDWLQQYPDKVMVSTYKDNKLVTTWMCLDPAIKITNLIREGKPENRFNRFDIIYPDI